MMVLPSTTGDEAITAPMSPGKRILYVAGSPARFIKTQVRPGSTNASVFSLVIVCMGAGTLTFPYVIYENGFVLGVLLVLFGGAISAATGYMIIYCIEQTKATCFEEIALACFNKRWQRFTSMCMIACNVGFTTSYFVLVSPFDLCLTFFSSLTVQIIHAVRHSEGKREAAARVVHRHCQRLDVLGLYIRCK